MKIIELGCIDSTNEYCKRENFPFGVAVIAKEQTGGRGTKGRSFISGEGGLYITVVRHYENFPARDAFKILINACAAVCETLDSLSLNPTVRWANDVLAEGKKISGTLIENTFRGGYLTRSIVGIGININNEIPPELFDIATSVKLVTGKVNRVEKVARTLLENLQKGYTLEDYKRRAVFLGSTVTVTADKSAYRAVALDICDDGRLKVMKADGSVENLSSAEVSLKI